MLCKLEMIKSLKFINRFGEHEEVATNRATFKN